jgi:hypothetical protein
MGTQMRLAAFEVRYYPDARSGEVGIIVRNASDALARARELQRVPAISDIAIKDDAGRIYSLADFEIACQRQAAATIAVTKRAS